MIISRDSEAGRAAIENAEADRHRLASQEEEREDVKGTANSKGTSSGEILCGVGLAILLAACLLISGLDVIPGPLNEDGTLLLLLGIVAVITGPPLAWYYVNWSPLQD
jgi:hypothetical protein